MMLLKSNKVFQFESTKLTKVKLDTEATKDPIRSIMIY